MKYNPYLKNFKTCVFDIETTGLYPKQDRIISASFVEPDGNNLVQFFNEAPQFEDIILQQIYDKLSEYDAVITYNGDMFDLPFVLYRLKKFKIADALPKFWSIDIYRWLRKYWPQTASMPSLRQKCVEDALGLSENRTDEIGGGECISLYERYVDWNEEEAKELILLHNGDDVRQLAKISQKLSFLPYHQIAFEKGFMFKNKENGKYFIKECKLQKTKICIKAQFVKNHLDADIYNDDYHLSYDSESGKISLDIFVNSKDVYTYIDTIKLPISGDLFANSDNLKSGYLILADKDDINYRECNLLSEELIKSCKL